MSSDLHLLLPKRSKRSSEGNEKAIGVLGGMNRRPNLGSSGSSRQTSGFRSLQSLPSRLLQTSSIIQTPTQRDCLSLPLSDGLCKLLISCLNEQHKLISSTSLHPFGTLVEELGPIGDAEVETSALLKDCNFPTEEFNELAIKCLPPLPWS